jgi:hypothetical protein
MNREPSRLVSDIPAKYRLGATRRKRKKNATDGQLRLL